MLEELNKFSHEELHNRMILINQNISELKKEIDRSNKKIRKGLIWWMILPIFGILIYYICLNSRISKNQLLVNSIENIKIEVTKLEFENMKIKLIINKN